MFKKLSTYFAAVAFILVSGVLIGHTVLEGHRAMGPLGQARTPIVGANGQVIWVPNAEAAGVNINTVSNATDAATCDWSIAPYCRVNILGTALTTLTLGKGAGTVGAPVDGNQYIVEFVQGTTAGAVTWPSGTNGVTGPGGQTAPTVSTGTSISDIYVIQYIASSNGYTVVSSMQAAGQVNNACAGVVQASAGVASTKAACLSGATVVNCIPLSATTPVAYIDSSVSGTSITCLYSTANANATTGWQRIQ